MDDRDRSIDIPPSHPIGHEIRRVREGDTVVKPVGWLSALWVMLKAARIRRDDRIEQLRDAAGLIAAGYPGFALERLEALSAQHPDFNPRCLGLISLALYELGNDAEALVRHRQAIAAGTAHPKMIEIFGNPPN